jgi:hypothetical protein
MRLSILLAAAAVVLGGANISIAAEKAAKITFKKTRLDDKFRSEGVAVGDYNHDGQLDIAAANVYYAAPDWKMHAIVDNPEVFDPAVYSHSFCNFTDDVNRDGWDDLIVVDFPGQQTWWFQNPQTAGGPWTRHVCVPVTNNESPQYLDVNGDDVRELLFADGTPAVALANPTKDWKAEWKIRPISTKGAPATNKFSHGIGAGDINKDGRNDVLCTEGWWQAPAAGSSGEWQFHPAKLGENCAQMHVYDFDGDGDNDVLSSSAHAFGIWWHEQSPDGWKTHLITDEFSQTHSVCLADINQDGLPDFVTGKRWWAHGASGDPGSDKPAVMFWFELSRKEGKPVWTPHQFDHDSGVGTQFEVADVNGDGLLDVVTANKKGTHYFEQVRE